MVTITVDDRQLVVTRVVNILTKIEPNCNHLSFTDTKQALQFASDNTVDVAFLDVEMPDMTGIELAKKLQELNSRINIIFITGYKEYMPEAFDLYASGYLLKPIREEDVRNSLAHLRYQVKDNETENVEKHYDIRVQCFGNFEIYYKDEVITFSRSRCKEIIAYLIDRKGTVCSNDMLMGTLWPDRVPNSSLKSMLRTLIADTRRVLEEYGIGDIIVKENGGLRIDVTKIDCDYYRFLDGDLRMERKYLGEYMSQYSFAEMTRAFLFNSYKGI